MALMRTTFTVLASSIIALLLVACQPGNNGTDDQNSQASSEEEAALRAAFEAADWPHEASDIPADENVVYGVLDNGMRYAIMANDTPSGTAAVRFAFNIGSLAEEDNQRGLAHFIEHMAFNGTTNVPEGEMVSLLERYGLAFGADSNAGTGRELVVYQLNLPSAEEELLNVGLFLMRETASEMLLDIEAIDRERGIILGEERFRNTPIRRYQNAYIDFLYPDTIIVERDAIGTVDVIENSTREDFVELYEDVYRPENAILVITGDFDPAVVENKIRNGFDISIPGLEVSEVESFATWQSPDTEPTFPDIGNVEAFTEADFGYFYDPEIFTLIQIGVITPGLPDLDTRETRYQDLLRSLGNGIVSRRINRLINSGESSLVQAGLSYSNEYDLANKANVFAVASPETWQEELGTLEQELRRAVEHGFTRSELEEQLANLRTSLNNAVDQAGTRQTEGLADSLWSSWLGGTVFTHPEFRLEWFESIEEEITVEAVEAAFNEIWSAAPPQVFVSVNQDIDNPEEVVREAWEQSTEVPVEAPEESENAEFAYTEFGDPGEVVSTARVEDFEIDQFVFDNGVKLNVKTTDFEDNVIRIRVDFGAGNLTPQPTPAAGIMLGASFTGGGLEAHDTDELQSLLAGRSVGYSMSVLEDSFIFNQTTTPTDFELQMQVITAFMTAPGWRDDGLRRFRGFSQEIRRGMNSSAVQKTQTTVSRMLRGGDSRWGFPTAEEVDAYSMEHGQAMLAGSLNSAPIEVTIVGDVDTQTAVDIVSRTLGALPERADSWPRYEENRQIEFPDPVTDPLVVPFAGQDYQGMANVYWPTGDGIDARQRRALNLLTRIMDLKATDLFREEEGATYSAIVSNTSSQVFEDYGYIWLGLDVNVDDIPRMYELADQLAATLAGGDISEDELLRARQPLVESLEEAFETNNFWLGQVSRSQTSPDRLEELRSLIDDYRSFTVEDMRAIAAEYLDPDRAYRVSILPESVVDSSE